MKDNARIVIGIFDARKQCERAVEELRAMGFRSADISILVPLAAKFDDANRSTAKLFDHLPGIGSFAIPGTGPVVAFGPIMGILAGAAARGLVESLIVIGIGEFEAQRCQSYVHDGAILLSVHCDDDPWQFKAECCLRFHGAKELISRFPATVAAADYRGHGIG